MKRTIPISNNIKLALWMASVLLFVVSLIIIIKVNDSRSEGYVARTLVFKAVALAKTDKDSCSRVTADSSRFSEDEQKQWVVPYMDYLYEEGFLDPEITDPSVQGAGGWLTYEEAGLLVESASKNLKGRVKVTKKNKDKPVSATEWWLWYTDMLPYLDPDGHLESTVLSIYGTPANVEGAPEWTAYTNRGILGFSGIGLDRYIDCQVRVLLRGNEIVRAIGLESEDMVYPNVWLLEAGKDELQFQIGAVTRTFEYDNKKLPLADVISNLADVFLSEGEITRITLKKETITGKVLAVKEDSIEIEGYGSVAMGENFQVYKVYGGFKQQKLKDILVGYDLHEFVVADGKLCAALTRRAFDAKTIRVLLMDTGFSSLFQPQVVWTADCDVMLQYGEKEAVVPAGTQTTVNMDDKMFSEGRILLKPQASNGVITISSISRAQGSPGYGGSLELSLEDSGIVVVNELYLEDYLKKVVPSEMPASYEKEALKAQAVCARSYAYKQIQGNSYSQYGAHVDDSTRFQVYNNIETNSRTDAAVDETYGRMLFLNGQVQDAYYFSTSCGHTTDGTIWGSKLEDVPYLKGVLLRDGRTLDLTSNTAFDEFIKNTQYQSYESSFALYRWHVTMTSTMLQEKITGIGTITDMVMLERGTGGIGKQLKVIGTEGEKIISGQSQIRTLLGNTSSSIIKNDDNVITGWDTIPSAFISIDNLGKSEDGITSFEIWGGGYGHGVGMSQNGAQGMALEGKTYEQILKFFYSGVEIRENQ